MGVGQFMLEWAVVKVSLVPVALPCCLSFWWPPCHSSVLWQSTKITRSWGNSCHFPETFTVFTTMSQNKFLYLINNLVSGILLQQQQWWRCGKKERDLRTCANLFSRSWWHCHTELIWNYSRLWLRTTKDSVCNQLVPLPLCLWQGSISWRKNCLPHGIQESNGEKGSIDSKCPSRAQPQYVTAISQTSLSDILSSPQIPQAGGYALGTEVAGQKSRSKPWKDMLPTGNWDCQWGFWPP